MKDAPLNIVHVILSRGFAGSERSTAESCNEQCKTHQVTIIVHDKHRKKGKSVIDHLDSRVQVVEVPKSLLTKRHMKTALHDIAPDIIHCHLRRATRIVAKCKPHAKTVSTLHIKVNGKAFMKMDGLICNARWQMSQVPKEFRGHMLKANNSLVNHPTLEKPQIQALRNDLGVGPNEILIGAVGRYSKSKAWDTLIHAFKNLPELDNVQLRFFGEGSLLEELTELAGDDQRIRFEGFKEDIKDYYQAFDLLVCPSRFEPLPRVILEAMDAGTPVLASDSGGCKELVDDYGGACFKVDDVEDLQSQLRTLLNERPMRHKPDLSAHSIEQANAAVEQFYRILLATDFAYEASTGQVMPFDLRAA